MLQPTSVQKFNVFWQWFAKNQSLLFHLERNQNVLFLNLKSELEKVHPNLVFEFSTVLPNGTREFIISANGIISIFSVVIALVDSSPKLENWKFLAFRQPHLNITHIRYKNLVINLDDIFFRYAKDNTKIGLELNIRGFYESPEWTAATFIILDNVLGEYQAEMSLSYIYKKTLNENELKSLLPIRGLPKIVKALCVN